MKVLFLLIWILFLQACKHPLAIEGEGDILERLGGFRGCTLEEFQANSPRCTDNAVVDDDYIVSYEAVPRDGWRFLRWAGGTGCPLNSTAPYCDYDIPRVWVKFIDDDVPDFEPQATVAIFVQHVTKDVIVRGKATGGFGPLLGGATINPIRRHMVVAAVLLAGEAITITATGEVNLAGHRPEGIFATPDGLDFPGDERPGPFYYFPLEEASVDAGDQVLPIPSDVAFNAGALFGAFVAQGTVRSPGFVAQNDDPDPNKLIFGTLIPRLFAAGGIPSDSLFLIGSGPIRYEATEDGTLFLGVNDGTSNNNAGSFTASIMIE
jgi:hypothetical protein